MVVNNGVPGSSSKRTEAEESDARNRFVQTSYRHSKENPAGKKELNAIVLYARCPSEVSGEDFSNGC